MDEQNTNTEATGTETSEAGESKEGATGEEPAQASSDCETCSGC